jgi:hypothetical protein
MSATLLFNMFPLALLLFVFPVINRHIDFIRSLCIFVRKPGANLGVTIVLIIERAQWILLALFCASSSPMIPKTGTIFIRVLFSLPQILIRRRTLDELQYSFELPLE